MADGEEPDAFSRLRDLAIEAERRYAQREAAREAERQERERYSQAWTDVVRLMDFTRPIGVPMQQVYESGVAHLRNLASIIRARGHLEHLQRLHDYNLKCFNTGTQEYQRGSDGVAKLQRCCVSALILMASDSAVPDETVIAKLEETAPAARHGVGLREVAADVWEFYERRVDGYDPEAELAHLHTKDVDVATPAQPPQSDEKRIASSAIGILSALGVVPPKQLTPAQQMYLIWFAWQREGLKPAQIRDRWNAAYPSQLLNSDKRSAALHVRTCLKRIEKLISEWNC